MTQEELIRHLESLLFVSAEPAELAQLAGALDVTEPEIEAALAALGALCATRGIRVQRKGARVQLATASDASPYVEKFLGLTATTRLSQAALETLAIIAYRQPITRAEIEGLRGVDCDGVLRTLMARQLIGELERLDTVGHPIRYGTTFEFMRYFGIQRLDELPPLRVAEPQVAEAQTPAAPTESHEQFIAQTQDAAAPNDITAGQPASNELSATTGATPATGGSAPVAGELNAHDGETSGARSGTSSPGGAAAALDATGGQRAG
ncbi:MAG: SMC-Scp complex subunit ScpB [Chloroflexi bacterium]|nr:SMC-Scp complex subunit ScpB [Chloroflexota bacterium]